MPPTTGSVFSSGGSVSSIGVPSAWILVDAAARRRARPRAGSSAAGSSVGRLGGGRPRRRPAHRRPCRRRRHRTPLRRAPRERHCNEPHAGGADGYDDLRVMWRSPLRVVGERSRHRCDGRYIIDLLGARFALVGTSRTCHLPRDTVGGMAVDVVKRCRADETSTSTTTIPARRSGGSKDAAKRAFADGDRRASPICSSVCSPTRSSALLVVLQAMDAGGKDGTIRSVLTGVNPAGVDVNSFGVPTDEERAHDYLWRVHAHTPAKGIIGIFNRSHYEDVLVVRVKEFVARGRLDAAVRAHPRLRALLVDEGTPRRQVVPQRVQRGATRAAPGSGRRPRRTLEVPAAATSTIERSGTTTGSAFRDAIRETDDRRCPVVRRAGRPQVGSQPGRRPDPASPPGATSIPSSAEPEQGIEGVSSRSRHRTCRHPVRDRDQELDRTATLRAVPFCTVDPVTVLVPTSLDGVLDALAADTDACSSRAAPISWSSSTRGTVGCPSHPPQRSSRSPGCPSSRSWTIDPAARTLTLGAGVRWADIEREPLRSAVPALAEAARTVGSPQIRNAGTRRRQPRPRAHRPATGCPSSQRARPRCTLASTQGRRSLAVGDFMVGVKRTALEPGELIESITIPLLDGWQGYSKVGRTQRDGDRHRERVCRRRRSRPIRPDRTRIGRAHRHPMHRSRSSVAVGAVDWELRAIARCCSGRRRPDRGRRQVDRSTTTDRRLRTVGTQSSVMVQRLLLRAFPGEPETGS